MASDYGRGRSRAGKIHIADPQYRRLALCFSLGCVETVNVDAPEYLQVVSCKSCLAIYEKRKAAGQWKTAAN